MILVKYRSYAHLKILIYFSIYLLESKLNMHAYMYDFKLCYNGKLNQ
jgi:hypothetical protein